MGQPRAYSRNKNFTENFGSETDHSALNEELDAAGNSINDIRNNLAILQADDGKLRPGVVTSDSISSELRASLVEGVTADTVALTAAAQASADAAAASASEAATQANLATTNGAAQVTLAAGQVTLATTQATNAAGSATAAASSATAAANSATASANSATAAAGSAASAAASLTAAGLPASFVGKALNWLRVKADELGYELRTAVQARGDLGAAASGANSDITSITGLTTGLATSRVKGLIGAPNAATPLTKYDLSADEIVMRNATGQTWTEYNVANSTVDFGLAGPAVNGRDQAGAFAAGSWVYVYRIGNPTAGTRGWIASPIAPSAFTAATLPAGYTFWALATELRWNASSNIIPALTKGSNVTYDVTSEPGGAGILEVLTSGRATAMTALSLAGLVPPNVVLAKIMFALVLINTGAGTTISLFARATGSTQAGSLATAVTISVSNVVVSNHNAFEVPVGTSQQIDYKLSFTPSGVGGAHVVVLGYKIPNGDV